MRLAPESHKQIESFLREYLKDEGLKLPPVFIYSGRFARWLTETLSILAITFGRRIFIAPKVIKLDESSHLTVPASLIAHEAVHVVQYHRAGVIGFFFSYLREYFGVLRKQKQGWGKAARTAAYFGIEHELEAYAAEAAYASWRPLQKMLEKQQESGVRIQNPE
jgi:hypothetical protein